MRKWLKVTLIVVAIGAVCFAVLAGTGAYYFLRHLETKTIAEKDTQKDFEAIRSRFPERKPLVEIVDPKTGDVRIQRTRHPEGRRASTLHILTWDAESERLLSTDVPLWLMRFSSVNLLSHAGIAPSRYRLTVEDVARYGPGIVVDFKRDGRHQVLIWVE